LEFATPEMTEKYLALLTNPKALQAAMADLSEQRRA
jgi:hypothetical protein